MSACLVTGAAGFIGFHIARELLKRGERVVGIDNLNDYYQVDLKRARLARLAEDNAFHFHHGDIGEPDALHAAATGVRLTRVVHLAAQAGVRYSLQNPHAYARSNLTGHLNVLELCRHSDSIEHLVYASSSSVYGGNTKTPFAEADRVDNPISLYAATKMADELMSGAYSHLYGLAQTGLRFFTVYGPWSRPDMATWLFTEAIFEDRPIKVFNHGQMERDFTYIDDIVDGVLKVVAAPPPDGGHRLYNIGNNRPVPLMNLISVLERAIGKTAIIEMTDMQPGDVASTRADITAIRRDHGFAPSVPIEVGIPRFVDWYSKYRGLG